MQARFYLPMYGRFASPDPARDQHFEETQSWNIYSYVQNDPTMRIDPTGEMLMDPSTAINLAVRAVTAYMAHQATASKPSSGRGSAAGSPKATGTQKASGHSEAAPTPGRKIWVSPTPDGGSDKGKLVDDGKGNYKGQCVSLAKKETGIPATSTWHAGAAVQGNTDIKPGTVVAAMKDGADWKSGGHVGLYVGQDANGLHMTDQFVTHGDHPVATRTYAWEGHGDNPSVQSQGANYRVVETGK